MNKKRKISLLIFLILILIVVNYNFLDSVLINFFDNSETFFVERVIDGDTFVINKTSVRMLGINTPERGEKYYAEAKEFLSKKVLNKSVKLEFGKEKYDLYKRILAYTFTDENVNLEIVKNGFANFYFPSGKDKYYSEFYTAWENCVKKNINLCEKSTDKCADCIFLEQFDVASQKIIFENTCGFDCNLNNWWIKDEGRKKFIFDNFILKKNSYVEIVVGNFTNTPQKLFWKNEKYVWTETGDTLFLRDSSGKLVLWKNY